MYCNICNKRSILNFCINCNEDNIKKCSCGVLFNAYHHCFAYGYMKRTIELYDDYKIINSLNNYHHRDMKSSGIIFNKIYDSLLKDNVNDAIKMINEHNKEIKIFVYTLTGKVITLKVSSRLDIIYPIKVLIKESQSVPFESQRLVWGSILEYDKTYKFTDEMSLHMVLNIKGD